MDGIMEETNNNALDKIENSVNVDEQEAELQHTLNGLSVIEENANVGNSETSEGADAANRPSPEPEVRSSDSPLLKSLQNALANLDAQVVGELLGKAPYLASAMIDQQKFHNSLHELVIHYTESEKADADERFAAVLQVLGNHDIDFNETDINGNSALLMLCDHPGYTEGIQALAAKSNVNLLSKTHQTALHKAVLGGFEMDIEKLLEKGADPNIMDSMGHSPLHLAVTRKRCHPVVKLLVGCGADVNLQDVRPGIHGPTPLHVAARAGSFDAVKTLLELGAMPDLRNSAGQTPLHIAAVHDLSNKCAKCLILFQASINAIDELYGDTPLHKAIKMGMSNMAGYLIQSGAQVNAQDHMWNTPLHVAATKCRDAHVWNLLMKATGDPMAKNRNGQTPLSEAQRAKNHEALMVIKQFYDNLKL